MVSYAADIKGMFRPVDVNSMKPRGLDLWSYPDVYAQADTILVRLKDGTMPCDDAWSDEWIAQFQQWITDGKQP
jgi:hypothetical protein